MSYNNQSGWTLRVKASLEQRIDYQVKCDRSIEFGATKREPEVKTTTKMTTTCGGEVHLRKAKKDGAEPIPKSRILIADRTPAKEPT